MDFKTPYQPILEESQSYRSLMKFAWQLFKTHKTDILKIFLLVYIPATLFSNSLGRFDGMLSNDWILNVVIFLISICILTVAYVSLIHFTHSVVHDISTNWQEAVNLGYLRLGTAIANSALSTLYILLWSLLLLIPGIIAATRYTFVLQATVIKGLRGHEALDFSKSLAKGRTPSLFGILALYIATYLGGNALLVQILTAVLPFMGTFSINVVAGLVTGLMEIVFTIFITLLFINLDFTGTELEA